LFWWTAPSDLNIPCFYHLSGEFKATWCLSETLPKHASDGGDLWQEEEDKINSHSTLHLEHGTWPLDGFCSFELSSSVHV
jgi:hypothetical protein